MTLFRNIFGSTSNVCLGGEKIVASSGVEQTFLFLHLIHFKLKYLPVTERGTIIQYK